MLAVSLGGLSPADSPLQIGKLADLLRPEVQRVAIANPDHAPYGMAARQAMQIGGSGDVVQPKLVLGENVRQTLQYAADGRRGTEVVIVAFPSIGACTAWAGRALCWTLIAEQLHPPIDQALAVIKGTPHEAAARAFAAFVNGSHGPADHAQVRFHLARRGANPMNWHPLLLSLKVTTVATILMTAVGLPVRSAAGVTALPRRHRPGSAGELAPGAAAHRGGLLPVVGIWPQRPPGRSIRLAHSFHLGRGGPCLGRGRPAAAGALGVGSHCRRRSRS